MKQFVVFMCPKCRNFTNAPLGQKRRRCSYCGTIIDITKANCALFDSSEQALVAVKEFNAARGGEEFKMAVERSRERYLSLMPEVPVDIDKIRHDDGQPMLTGKRKRMMAILEKEAWEEPCSLDRLEQVCNAKGLDWEWVERTIQALSDSGTLVFPRPWEVQLVQAADNTTPKERVTKDVASEIITFLKAHNRRIRVEEIVEHFRKSGVEKESVESSLERLMRSGDIYQPIVGYVDLV